MTQEHNGELYAPGSDAAVRDGCTCPVLDNGHGAGYMGIKGTYVIAEGCPLHPPMVTDVFEPEPGT